MTFAAPIWLTITPVIVCIMVAVMAYGLKRRDTLLSRFAAARLLGDLTEKAGYKRTIIKAVCLILGIASIGIALARPQYGVEWTERKARGLDIVFVLDSSKSMLATDLRPNRLERAKFAVLDLVQRLESDRVGLVAFAGRAFLQTPPTLDYSAFRESLDAIEPGVMTRGGSDLGTAIKEAAKAFPTQNNVKVVVLLTDGEDLGGGAIEAATEAAKEGIKIYAIGIGTPEGEYLKIRNAQGNDEFVRNDQGQPVRSQLDEATLQGLATATGGSYSRLSDQSLDTLYSSVIANLPRQERESEMQEVRIERFQWALAAACLFLVLEILIRRRGNGTRLAAALAVILLFSPTESKAQAPLKEAAPAEAPAPPAPEQTDLGEALEATEASQEDLTEAEALDPRVRYNQAHKTLSDGNYETAIADYTQALHSTTDLTLQRDSLYNMGHASFQNGERAFQSKDFQTAIKQWKEAEGYFKSAHEIDATDTTADEDAQRVKARREALEAFLKQQKQQQQQNQDSKQQDQQQDPDQQKQDPQNQSDEQQKQDQQQSGDQQQDQQQSDDQQQSGDQQQDQNSQDGQDGTQQEPEPQDPQQQDPQQQENSTGKQEAPQEQEPQQGQESQSEEGSDQQEQQAASEANQQESTQDPLKDLPQPGDENEGEKEQPQPQPGEASTEDVPEGAPKGAAATGESAEGEPIDGMRLSEAEALLDSLRHREHLLPFTAPGAQPQKRDHRDW